LTTPLADLLARRIARAGPISIADFMAEALGHPEHGYYMTRDPLGAAGDFVTAPEVSQMFGELIGLWCAELWRGGGAPKPVRLVELGPGRGTLMADALRAARMMPGFADALSVHLVESSPALEAKQRRTLAGHKVQWHRSLDEVPDGPLLLIANEFFDVLPVRQFQYTPDGWRERMVGLADTGAGFRIGLAPGITSAETLIPADVRAAARPGDIAEICPAGISIMDAIARRIARHGGGALIVDYGHAESAPGETLQAVSRHARLDPLEAPGEADLTAHVDFAALARAAGEAGAAAHGPVPQGLFLSRLGIAERAARLGRDATPEQARDIEAACSRLIAAAEMGTLFKALAVVPRDRPAPPGFETMPEGAATS
jgi:NADH dehydrogenase [ubiquinone] 1 alpha subcomplex assembly factor 7